MRQLGATDEQNPKLLIFLFTLVFSIEHKRPCCQSQKCCCSYFLKAVSNCIPKDVTGRRSKNHANDAGQRCPESLAESWFVKTHLRYGGEYSAIGWFGP